MGDALDEACAVSAGLATASSRNDDPAARARTEFRLRALTNAGAVPERNSVVVTAQFLPRALGPRRTGRI